MGELIRCAELAAAIPDFNWRTGHSGELLTPEQSRKLRRLWKSFLTAVASGVGRL